MFFKAAVVDRVKVDLAGGLAVPDASPDPACGVLLSFTFEEFFAVAEKFGVMAGVFLDRGNELEGAMFVLGVVVGDEILRPFLGFGE